MNVNNSWVKLPRLGLGPGCAVFTGKTDPGGALYGLVFLRRPRTQIPKSRRP